MGVELKRTLPCITEKHDTHSLQITISCLHDMLWSYRGGRYIARHYEPREKTCVTVYRNWAALNVTAA